MRSNIKLGRIAGIEIGLHYSWFIIAALIAFSLGEQFHQYNSDWSSAQIWAAAIFTAVMFFVGLLLHELSHSLVAKAYGLKVRAITLFALGGVSQIEEDAKNAKTEFWVAIAGPIASFVVGGICLSLAYTMGWRQGVQPKTAATAVLFWLGYINIVLGLFNLIPGFPLDGGRVLRAIVWAIVKNADRATRFAARVGQVVAFLFILDGIWNFFRGAGFGGLWIAFIGWFLMDAAKASYAQVEITAAFRGVRVAEVMSRDCTTVNRGMSLQEFVDTYLLKTGQRCFAVEDQGRLVGLITPRDVGLIPRDRWDVTTIREAMRPLQDLQIISPETPVIDALQLMAKNDLNQLPVVANGTLQGIFSRSQMVQMLQARAELQLHAAHHPPGSPPHNRPV